MLDPDATDPEVVEALLHFHVVFADAWTARQVGAHMTCMEAEAVAGIMRLIRPMEAQAFLYGHANGETSPGDNDPEDQHHWMRDDYDAAAQDLDHMPDFPDAEGRCKECGQPIDLVVETFRHKGLSQEERERYRQMGEKKS